MLAIAGLRLVLGQRCGVAADSGGVCCRHGRTLTESWLSMMQKFSGRDEESISTLAMLTDTPLLQAGKLNASRPSRGCSRRPAPMQPAATTPQHCAHLSSLLAARRPAALIPRGSHRRLGPREAGRHGVLGGLAKLAEATEPAAVHRQLVDAE